MLDCIPGGDQRLEHRTFRSVLAEGLRRLAQVPLGHACRGQCTVGSGGGTLGIPGSAQSPTQIVRRPLSIDRRHAAANIGYQGD
jgi:hypothetical protein